MIYEQLLRKEKKLAVIGLGYVGLPIALAFARKISVIGFDINSQRVDLMRKGIDPSKELSAADFEDCDIEFTNSMDILRQASFFIVAVPTPVDEHNVPNLIPILKAAETVGHVLKKGDYVVFESTVYPGCTEEDCLPLMEINAGLRVGVDFKLGYSPERINPGDKQHTLSQVVKIVSACDLESLDQVAKVYGLVVEAGVHRASSIKVAEAAKVIENTQRDLNIAMMNELSIIFDRMGINTYEVLEAAGTKWNFLKFQPGLVGGHCIGVDPYYLTHKAKELGYHSQVILSGRNINDGMGRHIANKIIQHLIRQVGDLRQTKVLVKGATFKENVSDIRNSKVIDVILGLRDFLVQVDVVDPHADADAFRHEYGFELAQEIGSDYDAVVLAVPHSSFQGLNDAYFASLTKSHGMIFDLKGVYRNQINSRLYWSL